MRLVRRLARKGGFELSDIDLLIFTQVRKPSISITVLGNQAAVAFRACR